jgi:hypothetical protein
LRLVNKTKKIANKKKDKAGRNAGFFVPICQGLPGLSMPVRKDKALECRTRSFNLQSIATHLQASKSP